MSTSVSANIHFTCVSRFEVTAYAGQQGCLPFATIRSTDERGMSVATLMLRDPASIPLLRAALDEAESKLAAIMAHAAKEAS